MNLGDKIKRLRVKMGLTQEEVADRCDLSKGFISQVERDLTSPSIATLVDILECLGSTLKDFFSEPAAEKIVFGQDDTFSTENQEEGHTITWLIPNAQKNKMEPILVTIAPGGRSYEYSPFAGESFGYVASGAVTLVFGGVKKKVKKGESFYYKADSSCLIENGSKAEARVIWVSTPPNF